MCTVNRVSEWHYMFKDSHKSVEGNLHNGWIATLQNKDNVRQEQSTLHSKCQQIIAKRVRILVGSFHTILNNNMQMPCVCQHTIPMLMNEQYNNTTISGKFMTGVDRWLS